MMNPKSYLLSDVLKTVNFQDVGSNFDDLKVIQPNRPMMVMEYWTGWFDHWGKQTHLKRPIPTPAEYNNTLRKILDENASVNQYMFCGGTSFGFMAGSNWLKKRAFSDTTSYDYNAPLTEYGDWTAKYNITKQIVAQYFPSYLPTNFIFKRPEIATYATIKDDKILRLKNLFNYINDYKEELNLFGYQFETDNVIPMEMFPLRKGRTIPGQAYGYALYQKYYYCQGKF